MTLRVRRLGRRAAPAGALLSTEPGWRMRQLRLLGVGLFLALCFGAAVVRKLTCAPASVLFGGSVVLLLVALGVAFAAADSPVLWLLRDDC